MATSPRLVDIATEILSRVAAIAAGAAYHYTAGESGEGEVFFSESATYPVARLRAYGFEDRAFVQAGDGPQSIESVGVYELNLAVNSLDAPASTLARWAQDVAKAVEGDPKHLGLPSYVVGVRAANLIPYRAEEAVVAPFAAGRMRIEVRYRMARAAL